LMQWSLRREINATLHENELFRTDSAASKLMGAYVQLIEGAFLKDAIKTSLVKKTTASALRGVELDEGGLLPVERVWKLLDGQHTLFCAIIYCCCCGVVVVVVGSSSCCCCCFVVGFLSEWMFRRWWCRAVRFCCLALNSLDAVAGLLSNLVAQMNKVSFQLRVLCFYIRQEVERKFVNGGAQGVGAFIFLRLISPTIVSPDARGVTLEVSQPQRRILVQIAKVLQQLVNMVNRSGKKSEPALLLPCR
jgi:hypothetical protein